MPTATPPILDLDAAKREGQFPDGITIRLGGRDFTLPSELPVGVLDPILDLDLAALLKQVFDGLGDDRDEESIGQVVVDMLFNRPTLPKDLLDAVKDVFAQLFGADHEDFLDQQPSINDYVRLVQGLLPLYGVALGEAFGSRDSSASDGPTSSPTSPSTTESTPAASGATRKRRTSSASDG